MPALSPRTQQLQAGMNAGPDQETALFEQGMSEMAYNLLASRIRVEGTSAHIARPCGCVTSHVIKPGTGGTWETPSRQRFARILSAQCCKPCMAKLEWVKAMPK